MAHTSQATHTSQAPQAPAKSAQALGDSLPESAAELALCLAALAAEEKLWQEYIKALSAAENPAQDVFYPAQLHEARQFKMQLEYQQACCRAKINRLKLAEEL